MRGYLADLAFWTFFCWLAVSSTIAIPAVAIVLTLDHLYGGRK